MPSWWFLPLPQKEERFTHVIKRASSELRNRTMVELLAARPASGARVFAVVGANHVPMQAAALRCWLAR